MKAEPGMTVNLLFAGTAVADFAASLAWYQRFLGRPPDFFPHEREAVWQVTDTGWIYIVDDAARAGGGLLTLMVDNLELRIDEIARRGIEVGEIAWVVPESTRSAWITDPEGNRIQLAEVLGESA
jgi:catechol 2,3-dioxygenase-like lactoylglutathione lyase family enzyme